MRKEIVMSEVLVKQAKTFTDAASARAATFGKFCDSLGKWYLELKKYNCHY
jgi:hypothetical protein